MYRGAQTTTLLGGEGERGKGGKGEKLRQIVLIVLTILSSIVQHMQTYGTRSESNNIVIQSLYSHS